LIKLQNRTSLPDKSEALLVGTSQQLKQARPAVPSVTIAGVDLPVAEQMKVLGVVLDQRLTFEKHATAGQSRVITMPRRYGTSDTDIF